MSQYRRVWVPGGCYFFTVVTRNRQPWLTKPEVLTRLRQAFAKVMSARPFQLQAIVILPDHLHALWQLPESDHDFATRWRLIKHHVSTGAAGRWQPRYWEHLIRSEEDWKRHVAYIHYNPVKHGYVTSAGEWAWSSFRRAVRLGWHEPMWGSCPPEESFEGINE